MTHIIVGTAGHIDHGKTALVRALTGIDTDRLQEEKSRGISIDLGFAHLDLSGGLRVGFVDVPGHERFVKNMLAGATGIDAVLFIVAADESVKPQTREHFDICRLLKIQHGIIALTKIDRVNRETLDLVRLEVEELIAGSFLEGAPLHEVSSFTGAGLDGLKSEIERLGLSHFAKSAAGPFRLPIDRVFTMRGFGTVVTGTVASGRVAINDELQIYPGRKHVRIRGIQTHNQAAESAAAGQRAALNLAGIDTSELCRGMTLGTPGAFHETSTIGARIEMLGSAPSLKARTPVHFHAGTAEIEAEIRPLETERNPLAKIVLAEPTILCSGDRFILRRFSPVETIGGGKVLDPMPSARRRADLLTNLLALEAGNTLPQKEPQQRRPFRIAEVQKPTDELETQVEQRFLNAGLAVPALNELFSESNPTLTRMATYKLLSKKKLVRISPDFAVHTTAFDHLQTMLASKRGSVFSVPEFKEWTGVSRKYAIPLLEYLDRIRITKREGDRRIIL